ncbi:hypothetical protein D3981_004347 [Escherichia coli]|nr:hypothetical protein [Escherichia coli]
MVTDTNADQSRFYSLLSQYPRISVFWDQPEGECKTEALQTAMTRMSHSEAVLAKFFMSVWSACNADFDVVEAAGILDKKERLMVANWLADPFWP